MLNKKIYTLKLADIEIPLIKAINHAHRKRNIKRYQWITEAIKEKLEREGIEIKPEPEGDTND